MSNIEEHIRQAMKEGKFDNLQGKGKRLSLEDNPLADPEWRLAYHMLQSSGFTLPWIETRQRLENDITATRAAVQQVWEWRKTVMADKKHPIDLITVEWNRAEEKFRQKVSELNKQIRSYNLEAPSEHVHLNLLNADRELERLEKSDQESEGE